MARKSALLRAIFPSVDVRGSGESRAMSGRLAGTTDGRGWHVRAVLEGRVFTRDCSDWQHVERTRRWLQAHSHVPTANAGLTPAATK